MRGERVKAWPASAPRMNHRGRGPRRRAIFAMALRRAGHGGGEFGGSLAEELDLSFRKFSGQDQISICAALADRAHRLGHALNGVSGLNSAVRLHPSSPGSRKRPPVANCFSAPLHKGGMNGSIRRKQFRCQLGRRKHFRCFRRAGVRNEKARQNCRAFQRTDSASND